MTAFNKSDVVFMLSVRQENRYIISNVIQHNGHALYTTSTRCIATVLFHIIFRIMLLNIPAIALFQWLACTTGLAAFAFFVLSGCDPLANRDVQSPNQVFIYLFLYLF